MSKDLPWWKEKKELSLQRKQEERHGSASPGDSFLIVTEGTVTELVYFKMLRDSLRLFDVRVKIIPSHKTDPKGVVDFAADEVKALVRRVKRREIADTELKKYDHVWAVIDTDVAVREGIWNDVVQKARDRKVQLAHSTPCFEYWLLLHLTKTTRGSLVNGDAAKRAVRHELGIDYSTNRKVTKQAFAGLLSHWPTACRHAQEVRNHHESARTPSPANPSTEVDLLVRALNDSALPHFRKKLN